MIMPNTLREKLAAGAPTVGTHYLSADPDIPEIIGDTGLFDYAEFAAEYSTFDMRLLYHMARAGQCAGLPLMISDEAVRAGRLVELLSQARLPLGEVYAVYPSRRFQAMKVKAFLDFLMASLPLSGGGLLEPGAPGLLTSPA